MAADGYVRLSAAGPRVFGELGAPGSLLFVDVAPGVPLKRLREISPTRLHAGAQLVVRAPSDTTDEVLEIARSLGLDTPVARISHPLGQEPVVEGDHPGLAAPEIIERCRAVELAALLAFGNAVWRPEGYHYLLPSGRHAPGFVRLADAIRSPHDATVLSHWLAADLGEGCALVADSDTLTALLLAVELRMTREGIIPGPVHVLDHYPRTQADTDAVIRAVGGQTDRVLVVLSVNSSGSLRDRIVHSLQLNEGLFRSSSLHVLVSNQPVTAEVAGTHWLPLEGADPPVSPPAAPHGCADCRDPARSIVVPIDPRTFDGRLPEEVVKKTLSLKDPQCNRDFFEICDAAAAIGIEEAPEDAVRAFRTGDRMAVKVRFERLLEEQRFADLVRSKIEEKVGAAPARLVLVPEPEWTLGGFETFRDLVMPGLVALDREDVVGFPVDGEWPDELVQQVRDAESITVFALGSVSGRSLQRALVSVQAAKQRPPREELRAIVVNARPAEQRDWETLRNSYGGRLDSVWITRVSERSPLVDESREIAALDPAELSAEVQALVEERRGLAEGAHAIEEVPLFLGSTADARLTPHSIYGQQLRAATTFFAVASAIEARRVEADLKPPQRLTFDVRAITRSYYDPLILASTLRWLHGPELWWGETPEEAEATVGEILERATLEQRGMLVPELLLAAALGKVPAEAGEVVKARADELLSQADPLVQRAVRLGLALVTRVA